MTGQSRYHRFRESLLGMTDKEYRSLVGTVRLGYRWTKSDVDRLQELVARIRKK